MFIDPKGSPVFMHFLRCLKWMFSSISNVYSKRHTKSRNRKKCFENQFSPKTFYPKKGSNFYQTPLHQIITKQPYGLAHIMPYSTTFATIKPKYEHKCLVCPFSSVSIPSILECVRLNFGKPIKVLIKAERLNTKKKNVKTVKRIPNKGNLCTQQFFSIHIMLFMLCSYKWSFKSFSFTYRNK